MVSATSVGVAFASVIATVGCILVYMFIGVSPASSTTTPVYGQYAEWELFTEKIGACADTTTTFEDAQSGLELLSPGYTQRATQEGGLGGSCGPALSTLTFRTWWHIGSGFQLEVFSPNSNANGNGYSAYFRGAVESTAGAYPLYTNNWVWKGWTGKSSTQVTVAPQYWTSTGVVSVNHELNATPISNMCIIFSTATSTMGSFFNDLLDMFADQFNSYRTQWSDFGTTMTVKAFDMATDTVNNAENCASTITKEGIFAAYNAIVKLKAKLIAEKAVSGPYMGQYNNLYHIKALILAGVTNGWAGMTNSWISVHNIVNLALCGSTNCNNLFNKLVSQSGAVSTTCSCASGQTGYLSACPSAAVACYTMNWQDPTAGTMGGKSVYVHVFPGLLDGGGFKTLPRVFTRVADSTIWSQYNDPQTDTSLAAVYNVVAQVASSAFNYLAYDDTSVDNNDMWVAYAYSAAGLLTATAYLGPSPSPITSIGVPLDNQAYFTLSQTVNMQMPTGWYKNVYLSGGFTVDQNKPYPFKMHTGCTYSGVYEGFQASPTGTFTLRPNLPPNNPPTPAPTAPPTSPPSPPSGMSINKLQTTIRGRTIEEQVSADAELQSATTTMPFSAYSDWWTGKGNLCGPDASWIKTRAVFTPSQLSSVTNPYKCTVIDPLALCSSIHDLACETDTFGWGIHSCKVDLDYRDCLQSALTYFGPTAAGPGDSAAGWYTRAQQALSLLSLVPCMRFVPFCGSFCGVRANKFIMIPVIAGWDVNLYPTATYPLIFDNGGRNAMTYWGDKATCTVNNCCSQTCANVCMRGGSCTQQCSCNSCQSCVKSTTYFPHALTASDLDKTSGWGCPGEKVPDDASCVADLPVGPHEICGGSSICTEIRQQMSTTPPREYFATHVTYAYQPVQYTNYQNQ